MTTKSGAILATDAHNCISSLRRAQLSLCARDETGGLGLLIGNGKAAFAEFGGRKVENSGYDGRRQLRGKEGIFVLRDFPPGQLRFHKWEADGGFTGEQADVLAQMFMHDEQIRQVPEALQPSFLNADEKHVATSG